MSQKKKDENLKTFLGMPMRWESKNMFKGMWDEEDDRLFPPKYFGIGWNINFHVLARKMGLIKNKKK